MQSLQLLRPQSVLPWRQDAKVDTQTSQIQKLLGALRLLAAVSLCLSWSRSVRALNCVWDGGRWLDGDLWTLGEVVWQNRFELFSVTAAEHSREVPCAVSFSTAQSIRINASSVRSDIFFRMKWNLQASAVKLMLLSILLKCPQCCLNIRTHTRTHAGHKREELSSTGSPFQTCLLKYSWESFGSSHIHINKAF